MTVEPRGLAFPLRFGPQGHLERAVGKDKLESNIRGVITTAMGERTMRSRLGTEAAGVVFRNFNTAHSTYVEATVQEALARYEPRVSVANVTAVSEEGGARIVIYIGYVIRSTGAFHEMSQAWEV